MIDVMIVAAGLIGFMVLLSLLAMWIERRYVVIPEGDLPPEFRFVSWGEIRSANGPPIGFLAIKLPWWGLSFHFPTGQDRWSQFWLVYVDGRGWFLHGEPCA